MTAFDIRELRRRSRTGFTLVEVLIVVIILGILAAIVIPQFSAASMQARTSQLQSTVQNLRTQIALYKSQHGDALPDLTANGGNNWLLLTTSSSYAGTTVAPYLQAIPTNALSTGSLVGDGTFSGGFRNGFDYVYDYNSGKGTGNIWAQNQNTPGGSILP